MNKAQVTLHTLFVRFVLWLSIVCFSIWLVKYSGIVWTLDGFFESLSVFIIDLAKKWGPLFAPSAAIIFVITMAKRSLFHELSSTLAAQLKHDLKESLNETLQSKVKSIAAKQAVQGIKSVYRGFLSQNFLSPNDVRRMYAISIHDFKTSAIDSQLSTPSL